MHRTLIIMAKEPRPGQVKTRLAKDIGTIAATWWFRHQVRGLLRRVRDPRWTTVLALSPDDACRNSRFWPLRVERFPQGRGDLGIRMNRQFDRFGGPVLIIGADIPGIERTHIWSAFRAMRGNDVVFGPATDGGFWAVGLRRAHQRPATMFAKVRWSTRHALQDSMKSVADRRTIMVQHLADVDTAADL